MRDLGGVSMCLDDVSIGSKIPEDHTHHTHNIFTRLQENGLIVNPEKRLFRQSELDFFGHRVNASDIHPLSNLVSAIQDFPRPVNFRQLWRFLGVVNFYHKFLP